MTGALNNFFNNLSSSPAGQVGLQLLAGKDLGSAAAEGTQAARANNKALQKDALEAQSIENEAAQKKLLNAAFSHIRASGVDISSPDFATQFANSPQAQGIDPQLLIETLGNLNGLSKSSGDAQRRLLESSLLQQALGGVVPQQGIPRQGVPQQGGLQQAIGGLSQDRQVAALLGKNSSLGRILEARADESAQIGKETRAEQFQIRKEQRAADATKEARRDLNQEAAIKSLPDDLAAGRGLIGLLDELVGSRDGKIKPHDGFSGSVGLQGSATLFGLKDEPFDTTSEKDFISRVRQIGGKQFLEAFQSIKGGGSITEEEGKKATAAIARIQDTGLDEDDYIAAVRDFQDLITARLQRASAAAGVPFEAGSGQVKTGATRRFVNGQFEDIR